MRDSRDAARQKNHRKIPARLRQCADFLETHRGHGDDRHVKGFPPQPPPDGHLADRPNDRQHNEIGDRTQESGDENAHSLDAFPV